MSQNDTTWAIYKLTQPPVYWDGPFKTRLQAVLAFRAQYQNAKGEQDFGVFKVVLTPVDVKVDRGQVEG
jgi:hypothetical protein